MVIIVTNVYSQTWQWANSIRGDSPQGIYDITVDNENNVYAAATSHLYTCIFNDTAFDVWGENDFFIAKYNSTGNEVWVKQGGGYWDWGPVPNDDWLHDYIKCLNYDKSSNSLVAFGNYAESCILGNVITLSTYSEDEQMFIAKFDLNGNCQWAKNAGSANNDRPWAMTLDNLGNIYVFGSLFLDGHFGSLPAFKGGNLAKLGPDGNCIWVKKIFDIFWVGQFPPHWVIPVNIIGMVYSNGYLYLNGNHTQPNFTIDTIAIISPDYNGQILTKFDTTGNIQWLKQFGGPTRSEMCGDIVADNENNIFIAGSFKEGMATIHNDTLYSDAEKEMYIIKLNSDGEIVWVNQTESTGITIPLGMCTGPKELYITGYFIGETLFNDSLIASSTNNDLFIANFDLDANLIDVITTHEAWCNSIKTDNLGSIFIAGSFMYPVNFGDTTLYTTNGIWDGFIAKHDSLYIPGNSSIETHPTDKLLIHPNPNDGKCKIIIPEQLKGEKSIEILIYNIRGELVLLRSTNQEEILLNLQGYPGGLYLVIINSEKTRYWKKMILR